MKRFFNWFFNFGAKYRKQEEEYHLESRRNKNIGQILGLFLLAALPLLSLWGAFKLPWDGEALIVLKVLCILMSCSIIKVASDILIIGIVALRHRMRMKVENKMIGALTDIVDDVPNKQNEQAYQAKGTNDRYDLAVGIVGIVLSVVVVIAFIIMFFVFCGQAIQSLT